MLSPDPMLTFRKGLTLLLFWIFFLDIFLVTFLGYLSMPATSAWLGSKGSQRQIHKGEKLLNISVDQKTRMISYSYITAI